MRSTAATRYALPALTILLALASCSAPGVTRERDGRRTLVRVGPIGIGFFRSMYVSAYVEPPSPVAEELADRPKPPDRVRVTFPGLPFDRVVFDIDGLHREYPRPLFEEGVVLLTTGEFREIAYGSFVGGAFDDGWGKFEISAADQDLLVDFAREIGALPR